MKGFAVLPLLLVVALFISGDVIFRTSPGDAAPGRPPKPLPGGRAQPPPPEIIADRNGDKIFDNLAARLAGKPDDVLFDVIVQFTLCPRSARSES